MSRSRKFIGGISALGLSLTGLVVSAGPSAAVTVGCGAVITQSTTLTSDVGPCTTDGLIVTASNIQLNLGGKRVFSVDAQGDIVGIRLNQVSGVTVSNGTVDGFNDGITLQGGSGNTVKAITAINNISDFAHANPCNFGDGISLFFSSNNWIVGNVANHNGPYGGISMVNSASGNQVIGNTTNDNNIGAPDSNLCINFDNPQQDEGIRIEGPGANNNTIKGNFVNGNLLAGIGIHASNTLGGHNDPPNINETIVGNTVRRNGHDSTSDTQSGISILGTPGAKSYGNTFKGNISTDNAADGIFVPATSHDNQLSGNTVTNNGKDGIFLGGPSFANRFTNVGPTLFQRLTPDPQTFVQGTNYAVLSGSGSGDVTAKVVPVGPISIPPTGFDTSASGCLPSDFAGFPVGAVALIQRGFCGRGTKADNAKAAGASAVIMFNEGSAGRTGLLTAGVNVTTIPVLGTTYALGVQLYNETQAGPVTVHIVTHTTNVRVQTGPGATNNTLKGNRGQLNAEHDGHDNTLAPPCDSNHWIGNVFGTVNQACVANFGTGTVKP